MAENCGTGLVPSERLSEAFQTTSRFVLFFVVLACAWPLSGGPPPQPQQHAPNGDSDEVATPDQQAATGDSQAPDEGSESE